MSITSAALLAPYAPIGGAARVAQQRMRRLREQPGGARVDRERVLPLLDAELEQGARADHARVADQASVAPGEDGGEATIDVPRSGAHTSPVLDCGSRRGRGGAHNAEALPDDGRSSESVGCISPIVRWRAAIWGSPVTDRRLLGRVRTGSVLASVSEASSTRIRALPAPRSNLCTPQGQGFTPRASGCPRLRREGVPAEASPSAVRGSWRSRPRPGISRPPMGDRTVRERDRATLTQRCIARAICAPDLAPLTGPGLTS